MASPLGREATNVLTDWELHKTVLLKNKRLAELHFQLVRQGALTDAEFWAGREVSLVSLVFTRPHPLR